MAGALASDSETAGRGVSVAAHVKWFDPKRRFGFCTCPTAGIPNRPQTEDRSEGGTCTDVFFGESEADAARVRGLMLKRGEEILCDVDYSGARPEARVLRPRRPPTLNSLETATDDVSSSTVSASMALETSVGEITGAIKPALQTVATFVQAAQSLERLMEIAWQQHAAAGRDKLEAFVQGDCFEAVQTFGRSTLLSPELGSVCHDGRIAARVAADWLTRLANGPWCWSPQQRRTLAEMRSTALRMHCSGADAGINESFEDVQQKPCDMIGDPMVADKIDSVLAQRTRRFVVVLEGLRNSANQQMICRTCEALGVQEVWVVPPPASSRYRATVPRSRQVSRGSERFLSLRRFANAAEVAATCTMEDRELWVTYCPPSGNGSCAATPCSCEPLEAGSVPAQMPRLALVLGTEGDGVSIEMLQLAARAIYLPMHGFVQSLNVAVACGMLLQRLFDLCPDARGDLPHSMRSSIRESVLRAAPSLGSNIATTARADSEHEFDQGEGLENDECVQSVPDAKRQR